MMVHESTSDRPTLSAESLQALEAAMLSYSANGTAPSSLEPALRRIADEAREKKVRAEQLLIALKDVWFSLPSLGRTGTPDEQNAMLQRIVSLSVRAYYSV